MRVVRFNAGNTMATKLLAQVQKYWYEQEMYDEEETRDSILHGAPPRREARNPNLFLEISIKDLVQEPNGVEEYDILISLLRGWRFYEDEKFMMNYVDKGW